MWILGCKEENTGLYEYFCNKHNFFESDLPNPRKNIWAGLETYWPAGTLKGTSAFWVGRMPGLVICRSYARQPNSQRARLPDSQTTWQPDCQTFFDDVFWWFVYDLLWLFDDFLMIFWWFSDDFLDDFLIIVSFTIALTLSSLTKSSWTSNL